MPSPLLSRFRPTRQLPPSPAALRMRFPDFKRCLEALSSSEVKTVLCQARLTAATALRPPGAGAPIRDASSPVNLGWAVAVLGVLGRSDRDADLRRQAAECLNRLVTPAMMANKPAEAAACLSGGADVEPLRERLIAGLSSSCSNVRAACARAAAGRATLTPYLTGLLADGCSNVRVAAARSLADAPYDPQAAGALLSLFNDPVAVVRETAARAVAVFLGEPGFRAATAARLSSPEEAVRLTTATALSSAVYDASLEPYLAAAAGDVSASVRLIAVRGLQRGDWRCPAMVIGALMERLTDADFQVSAAAAEALGYVADESSVAAALRLWGESSLASGKDLSALRVAASINAGLRAWLSDLAQSPNVTVAAQASPALEWVALQPAVFDTLVGHLTHACRALRVAAVTTAGRAFFSALSPSVAAELTDRLTRSPAPTEDASCMVHVLSLASSLADAFAFDAPPFFRKQNKIQSLPETLFVWSFSVLNPETPLFFLAREITDFVPRVAGKLFPASLPVRFGVWPARDLIFAPNPGVNVVPPQRGAMSVGRSAGVFIP